MHVLMTQHFFFEKSQFLERTFEKFERVSSLKLDLEKSEICGIGVKRGCRWRSVEVKLST